MKSIKECARQRRYHLIWSLCSRTRLAFTELGSNYTHFVIFVTLLTTFRNILAHHHGPAWHSVLFHVILSRRYIMMLSVSMPSILLACFLFINLNDILCCTAPTPSPTLFPRRRWTLYLTTTCPCPQQLLQPPTEFRVSESTTRRINFSSADSMCQ